MPLLRYACTSLHRCVRAAVRKLRGTLLDAFAAFDQLTQGGLEGLHQ